MVTHIPPPSPSLSSTSLSHRAQSTSSSIPPYRPQPSSYHYNASQSVAGYQSSRVSPTASRAPPSSYSSRAPSVSSRVSTQTAPTPREHHRRSHSHRSSCTVAAPTHTQPALENEFPWFAHSGNVEIIIRDRSGQKRENCYLLHALILAQNSGFFSEQLGPGLQGPANGAELDRGRALSRIREESGSRSGSTFSNRSSRGSVDGRGLSRWRYELDWGNPDDEDADEGPILVQCSAQQPYSPLRPGHSGPPISHPSFFRNLARNFSVSHSSSTQPTNTESTVIPTKEEDIMNAYNNLFLSFYNHSLRLDTTNIATAYVECKTLVSLASLYGCSSVIGPRVEHHLLGFHSRLWKQVAKYPPSYLKFGHKAQSRAIFAEAMTHVVGQWPAGAGQLRRGTVDDAVLDLVEDKVDELEEAKVRIDAKLFRLSLTTSRGERVTPANSWLDWLALSLFRQWFAEKSTPPTPGILKDSSTSRTNGRSRSSQRQQLNAHSRSPAAYTGQVYRLIGAGGQSYLRHDELKQFLKNRSRDLYSRDNLQRFERRMDEIKNLAKDSVKPLVRSFLQLHVTSSNGEEGGRGGSPYLTCTRLQERDYEFVWGRS